MIQPRPIKTEKDILDEKQGYLSFSEAEVVEDHKNHFFHTTKDEKVVFPYYFIKTSCIDRCYGLYQRHEITDNSTTG